MLLGKQNYCFHMCGGGDSDYRKTELGLGGNTVLNTTKTNFFLILLSFQPFYCTKIILLNLTKCLSSYIFCVHLLVYQLLIQRIKIYYLFNFSILIK